MTKRTVEAEAGDSLCNIAYLNGFGHCKALREDPANAYIVERETNPGQVEPGDIVTLPELRMREEDAATDDTYKLRKRGTLATVRFVHGSPSTPYALDTTLTHLNVSNYVTNRAGLPDGSSNFPDASVRDFNASADMDVDTFKVEVFDRQASGDLQVELEVLKPVYDAQGRLTGHTRFPGAVRGPRLLTQEASKQGSTKRYRTCYLRLVGDAVDKGAVDQQTLLVSDIYDAKDAETKRVEILDQRVKASYEIPTCRMNPKCKASVSLPVGNRKKRLRFAVHILRESVDGPPIVSIEDAEKRVMTWLRRSLAQMSIAPRLMTVREVDPPENLVSISNDSGLTAAGDGALGFTINATGLPSQIIGPIVPRRRATPLATARALAAAIEAPFRAEVSQNPARFTDPAGRRSADIVITAEGGQRVTISDRQSGDSRQTLRVGRPDPTMLREWNGTNWLVGSIEQRTILKNYDTGDDRFDLFIIQRFTSPNLLGAAMMSGHRVDPRRSAISKVKWSGFVDLRSSDSSDDFPYVIVHEAMHAVAEVMHAHGTDTQIMFPTADQTNTVGCAKRMRDGAVAYDGGRIAGNHNLVDRVRVEGAPLLEDW